MWPFWGYVGAMLGICGEFGGVCGVGWKETILTENFSVVLFCCHFGAMSGQCWAIWGIYAVSMLGHLVGYVGFHGSLWGG